MDYVVHRVWCVYMKLVVIELIQLVRLGRLYLHLVVFFVSVLWEPLVNPNTVLRYFGGSTS